MNLGLRRCRGVPVYAPDPEYEPEAPKASGDCAGYADDVMVQVPVAVFEGDALPPRPVAREQRDDPRRIRIRGFDEVKRQAHRERATDVGSPTIDPPIVIKAARDLLH